MKIIGIEGKSPKEKYRSYKCQIGKIADNIINRDYSTTAPLQNGLRMYFNLIFRGDSLIYHLS